MKSTHVITLCGLAVIFAVSISARAQEDSPKVQQDIAAAKKAAGTQWAAAEKLFCATEEQVTAMKILPSANANEPDEAVYVQPTRIFDNLYYVGTKQVATYVLTTSQGIILLDSGYAGKEETVLIPGMKKLGLDPADIKIAIITHGHLDHYGGAKYLQDHFGTHIYLSSQDWDFIQPRPSRRQGGQGGAIPKRDMTATEGQPITLGDESVTPVLIPGHTPGSLGLIFPVKDKGKVHMAALFGGTILNPARRFPVSMWQQYLMSINHFKEMTTAAKVDVELENHPIMDGTFGKLDKLREGKKAPNPFIVGRASFERWTDVLSGCAQAQLDRAEAKGPEKESSGQ